MKIFQLWQYALVISVVWATWAFSQHEVDWPSFGAGLAVGATMMVVLVHWAVSPPKDD
jgi:hypothetical protein